MPSTASRPYPRDVEVSGLTPRPLRFVAHSPVEYHRTHNLGGEPEALRRFLEGLRPGDIVFDIGASVGLLTVAAAVRVGHGRVVAFEPDPETADRLRHHVTLNGLTNVQVIPAAVGAEVGVTTLFTEGAAGMAPSLRPQGRANAPAGRIEVPVRSLDELVGSGDTPRPDVLKIDVEGAEGLVLRGAGRLLKGELGPPPRAVMIELHPAVLPAFGDRPDDVRDMLVAHGYRAAWSQVRDTEEHEWYDHRGGA